MEISSQSCINRLIIVIYKCTYYIYVCIYKFIYHIFLYIYSTIVYILFTVCVVFFFWFLPQVLVILSKSHLIVLAHLFLYRNVATVCFHLKEIFFNKVWKHLWGRQLTYFSKLLSKTASAFPRFPEKISLSEVYVTLGCKRFLWLI